jgi:hypothetical protein
MKRVKLLFASILGLSIFMSSFIMKGLEKPSGSPQPPDTLPLVLSVDHSGMIVTRLRNEGIERFKEHKLPGNVKDWEVYKTNVRNQIIKKAGVHINHKLPLNVREFGTITMKGYTIKNIAFQTLPGVYATANLFIPDGKGPFPAVINLHAHSGRFDDNDQAVGHSLAVHGYVCLSIDPWGAGERTTVHGVTEYHGSNLGASFMNIGESLMGIQITDNMRGVDLLSSLPYVDARNIGAAGASGGGNQTMWLAAVDERIKAAVPVVSVGTFESYVMRSNCICELLIDGLTFTEEAGVLALANAIMPCNHDKDSNPTFFSSEMLRSYENARPVFKMTGREKNLDYRTFDLPHGFLKEDREAMLGWFDLHLKNSGTGASRKELPFSLLTEAELMVYPKGKRDPDILNTEEYCIKRGTKLRNDYLKNSTFNIMQKKKELREILRISEKTGIVNINKYPVINGWERIALETSDNKLIPLLVKPASVGSAYAVLCDPRGKQRIPSSYIDEYSSKGFGIVLVDLAGTGEVGSPRDRMFQTLSRGELWLGRSILGDWVNDLEVVVKFLKTDKGAGKLVIDGSKEAGLAGLFFNAINGSADEVILRQSPASYIFDNRKTIDFFSMAIHVPGFLNWGDVSLAAGLTGKNVTFMNPVTMSGQAYSSEKLKEFQKEYDNIRKKCNQPGRAVLFQ